MYLSAAHHALVSTGQASLVRIVWLCAMYSVEQPATAAAGAPAQNDCPQLATHISKDVRPDTGTQFVVFTKISDGAQSQ